MGWVGPAQYAAEEMAAPVGTCTPSHAVAPVAQCRSGSTRMDGAQRDTHTPQTQPEPTLQINRPTMHTRTRHALPFINAKERAMPSWSMQLMRIP